MKEMESAMMLMQVEKDKDRIKAAELKKNELKKAENEKSRKSSEEG